MQKNFQFSKFQFQLTFKSSKFSTKFQKKSNNLEHKKIREKRIICIGNEIEFDKTQ